MLLFYILILFFAGSTIVFFILFLQKDRAYRNLIKKNLPQEETKSFILDQKVDFSGILPRDNIDQKLLDELQRLFEVEKIFLDKNLNINDLAKKMGTSKTTLSRIINSYCNENFPALLNKYRVNEAIKLLMNSQTKNYKMEYISDLSGYNNRQVFHSAFKKSTGLTPQRFRNVCRKDDCE